MPKFSGEGRVGLLMEIAVIILEQIHITEAWIIWPLFGLGALLIADGIFRGEWRDKYDELRKRKKTATWSVAASIFILACGGWLALRLGYFESNTPPSNPEISLKQRTQRFADEFYEWIDRKEKEAPQLIIIDDGKHEAANAYEMGKLEAYTEQARAEYDKKNFGPRAMALKDELARCGIDVGSRPFATNPSMLGNLGSARMNALIFRQIAVELPNDDKQLKCKK